jgi:predicted nucleotide-binding protein
VVRKVFLAHGHDSRALLDLEDFVRNLRLQPVVLREREHLSESLIAAFESVASGCDAAIALLTPDDRQAQDLSGKDKWRARQNVILEMGWFMRALGRERVILLHKGEVELPSDLLGLFYLHFAGSVFEVAGEIQAHLRRVGLL